MFSCLQLSHISETVQYAITIIIDNVVFIAEIALNVHKYNL